MEREEKGGWLQRESASETDVCGGSYCRGNHVSSGLAKAPHPRMSQRDQRPLTTKIEKASPQKPGYPTPGAKSTYMLQLNRTHGNA